MLKKEEGLWRRRMKKQSETVEKVEWLFRKKCWDDRDAAVQKRRLLHSTTAKRKITVFAIERVKWKRERGPKLNPLSNKWIESKKSTRWNNKKTITVIELEFNPGGRAKGRGEDLILLNR